MTIGPSSTTSWRRSALPNRTASFFFDDYTARKEYGIQRLIDNELIPRLPAKTLEVIDLESRDVTVGYRLKNRLADQIEAVQKQELRGYSPVALGQIQQLAENATSENVRLKANTDLLDRAGWKPIDKSEITTHDDVKNKTHDEIMEELDSLHRRCGLKTVAIDSVVLDKEHPDYQHYVNTEPELADFTSESDVPGWGDSDD